MRTIGKLVVVAAVGAMLALGGCGSTNPFSSDSYSGGIPSGAIPNGNGVIQAITRLQSTDDTYRFTIRMNSGQVHTLRHDGTAGFRVRDPVRIRNGMMERL